MLLLSLILTLFTTSHTFSAPFIYGGTDTTLTEHPWQVSIVQTHFHHCGGVIISKKFVVTAAHCKISKKDLVKGGGDGNRFNVKSLGKIKEVIVHPLWDEQNNDIALIEMENDIQFTNEIQPIRFVNPSLEKVILRNKKFLHTGWGETEQRRGANQLKVTDGFTLLPLSDSDFWKRQENLYLYFSEEGQRYFNIDYVAFKNHPGKGNCIGDSGGPLISWLGPGVPYLVGIASYSARPCGTKASVFTRVGYFANWIEEKIRDK